MFFYKQRKPQLFSRRCYQEPQDRKQIKSELLWAALGEAGTEASEAALKSSSPTSSGPPAASRNPEALLDTAGTLLPSGKPVLLGLAFRAQWNLGPAHLFGAITCHGTAHIPQVPATQTTHDPTCQAFLRLHTVATQCPLLGVSSCPSLYGEILVPFPGLAPSFYVNSSLMNNLDELPL